MEESGDGKSSVWRNQEFGGEMYATQWSNAWYMRLLHCSCVHFGEVTAGGSKWLDDTMQNSK